MQRSELHISDELPVWQRDGTVQHWSRFAAVNYEFAEHHWDDDVGKAEGFHGAFAMAPLLQSYVYAWLREWLGAGGAILDVNIRLRSPFLKGRVLTLTGSISAIDGAVISVEFTQRDDTGAQIATGTAQVKLSG